MQINLLFQLFQGNEADYEHAIAATKEAWNVWADVSSQHI